MSCKDVSKSIIMEILNEGSAYDQNNFFLSRQMGL